MEEIQNKKRTLKTSCVVYISCIVIAITIFILIYGYKVLNVSYDDWILHRMDDLTQHYLGWKAYRNSSWNFPIGMIDNVIEPFKLSINYTDSIPVVAFISKLFSPFLPSKFQYFGIYGLICFVLSAVFTARILMRFTNNIIGVILSSAFVILLPVLYERMYTHTALASHWIILYALYYIFCYKFDKKISIWLLVVFPILSSSIHLYFLPMNFIIILAYAILCSYDKKKISCFFLIIMSYILISILVIYIFGGFDMIGDYDDNIAGNSTLNLNSLFQTLGRSRFFSSLSTHTMYPGESFIYIGLGGILIFCFVLIYIVFTKNIYTIILRNKELMLVLMFIIICSIIISVVPDIYFNDTLILKLRFSGVVKYVFDIFRSNARFIWVGYYVGIVALLIIICKYIDIKYAIFIMILSISLQVIDYFNTFKILNNYYAYHITYKSQLVDDVWNKISVNKKICIYVYYKKRSKIAGQ